MSSAAPADSAPRPELRLVRGRLRLVVEREPVVEGAGDEGADEMFHGLRVVRSLAMLSIVGFHVTWEPIFGIAFGLTSLQIITCALTGRRALQPATAHFARRRARRLLAPWLAWSAIYAVFELARGLLAGEAPLGRFEPWMWFSGASFHLWFLPFAFVACLAVHAALRVARTLQPEVDGLAAAVAGAGLLLAVDPLKRALEPGEPFHLWLDGLPTVAFGLAIGRALALRQPVLRARLLLGIALVGLVPFGLGATLLPASGLYERYAVALCVVCLGLILPLADRAWMAALAATNLGVYLAHMLVIRVADHAPGFAGLGGAARSLAVYALCLGAVLALRRAPLRLGRWLT